MERASRERWREGERERGREGGVYAYNLLEHLDRRSCVGNATGRRHGESGDSSLAARCKQASLNGQSQRPVSTANLVHPTPLIEQTRTNKTQESVLVVHTHDFCCLGRQ
ncbi:MAG: hypothetical protein ACPIOQ_37880, partial [Promethearchaeia archaeon]